MKKISLLIVAICVFMLCSCSQKITIVNLDNQESNDLIAELKIVINDDNYEFTKSQIVKMKEETKYKPHIDAFDSALSENASKYTISAKSIYMWMNSLGGEIQKEELERNANKKLYVEHTGDLNFTIS